MSIEPDQTEKDINVSPDPEFGFGKLFTALPSGVSEDKILEHTLKLAWHHGCPRPNKVIETYGSERTMERYATVNYAFRRILMEVSAQNPPLFADLATPKPRLPEEPVGMFEPGAVPASHEFVIAPMSGLVGYAAPRLIVLREASGTRMCFFADKQIKAQQVLARNLGASNSLEFLAKLVKDLGNEPDIERIDILHHALPEGVLLEENCHTIYQEFSEILDRVAPEMYNFYTQLTPFQKKEMQIANVPL